MNAVRDGVNIRRQHHVGFGLWLADRRAASGQPAPAAGTLPIVNALPDMPSVRAHLPFSLAHQEIRRSCMVVEHIMAAGDMLDRLPPDCLVAIRDYCTEWNKDRKGSESEFKAAWIAMVVDHLNDARLRERRLYTGITGKSSG
jgi:hypothetical protein